MTFYLVDPMSPMPDIEAERERRKVLLAKAKQGDEDALCELRDGYRVRTLILGKRRLIADGVLVGAKP